MNKPTMISGKTFSQRERYSYSYYLATPKCFRLVYTHLVNRIECQYELEEEVINEIVKHAQLSSFDEIVESASPIHYQCFSVKEKKLYFGKKFLKNSIKEKKLQPLPLSVPEIEAVNAFELLKRIDQFNFYKHFESHQTTSIRQICLEGPFVFPNKSNKIKSLFKEVPRGNNSQIEDDLSYYYSSCFKTAAKNGRLYFNPTVSTIVMLKQIFQMIFRRNISIFLIGKEGIGKSFSLAFLCQVTNIIERYKVSVGFNANTFEGKLKIDKLYGYSTLTSKRFLFTRMPKIFYVHFSTSFNEGTTVQTIMQQSPQFFYIYQQSILNFNHLIRQLQRFYWKYSIDIVFIVDQFNVYTSQLRKCSEDPRLSRVIMQTMTKFLLQIHDIKTIFCSSPNFEQQAFHLDHIYAKNIFHHNYQIQKVNLTNPLGLSGDSYKVIEVIHTILFEIEMQIYAQAEDKEILISHLTRKRELLLKSQFFNKLLLNLQGMQYACITHLQINKHLRSFLMTELPFLICADDDIEMQFRNLLLKIRNYYFSSLRDHFSNYINQGYKADRLGKLEAISILRNLAFQIVEKNQSDQNDDYSFECDDLLEPKFKELQEKLTDTTHISVDRKNAKITVFLNPSTFLQATENIRVSNLGAQFYQKQLQKKEQAQLGHYIQRFYVTSLSRSGSKHLQISFHTEVYQIQKNNYSFVHIQKNMDIINPLVSYSVLMKLVAFKQIKGSQFLCAYPICKNKNKSSPNSCAIDLLLINTLDQGQQYRVISLDFTVTKSTQLLVDKYKRAIEYFEWLQSKHPDAYHKLTIEHRIIAPVSTIISMFKMDFNIESHTLRSELMKKSQHLSQTKKIKGKVRMVPLEDFSIVYPAQNITQNAEEQAEYSAIKKAMHFPNINN